MREFRKFLTAKEIEDGTIYWDEEEDNSLQDVIPQQTLVFDLIYNEKEFSNLSTDWEKRALFVGTPIAHAFPGSELVLSFREEKPTLLFCSILPPLDRILIKKCLSYQEYNRRYLKWFAREDDLYNRLFAGVSDFSIEISGKRIKGRLPDFEKRTLLVGDLLRAFSPGDNLLVSWSNLLAGDLVLQIKKDETLLRSATDDSNPVRLLVTKLLSRSLSSFNEGEVKALLVLLEENKKLFERIVSFQEENRKLKEQISMLESLFEQFISSSFFRSKRDFEVWVANHITQFEKGLRITHRSYEITVDNLQKRRIDLLCQDKKAVMVVVQILYSPDASQIQEAFDMIDYLRNNTSELGFEITDGLLRARKIRAIIISNQENEDLIEHCLQNQIKLSIIKTGCLIDTFEE